MKDFQDRVLKDFDVKQVQDEKGKRKNVYVYKGDWALWEGEEEEIRHAKRLELAALVLAIAGYLWGALQAVPMNASHLVGAFTLLTAVALMALLIGVVGFLRTKGRMYLRDCRNIYDTIVWSSMIGFLLQLSNVISAVVYMVTSQISGTQILVLLAHAAVGILLLVIFRTHQKLGYRKIELKIEQAAGDVPERK